MLQQLNESQVSLTQTQNEIDTIEAQRTTIKLLKKEKAPPAEDYLKSVRDLERCIPSFQLCGDDDDTKNYYQLLLEGGQSLHETALKGEMKIDEVENNLEGILKQFNSLSSMLTDYKNVSYQQKFDINKFNVVLNSIQGYSECLKKNNVELSELVECVHSIKFGSDSTNHLGQEMPEESVQRDLQINKTEEESSKRHNAIVERLKELNEKIHENELKDKESTKKREELKESQEKLKRILQEKEVLIQEKEENLLTYVEKVEQLEIEVNQEFASKLSNIESKGEKEQEKVIERQNKLNEKRDEIRSMLYQQLSENCAKSPWKHYIVLLDHSESMKGPRWNAVTNAVGKFVEKNKCQVSDLLSVIGFDNTATEIFKKIKFSDYLTPSISKWGGTDFDPAFKMALGISNLSRTHCPIVIFLTDGEGKKKETPNILREMSTSHKDKGFMFFSIGVGENGGNQLESLQQITRIANNGNLFVDLGNHRIEFLHTTKDEGILEKIFVEISDAIHTFEHNVKSAIEALDKERNETEEEAKRQYELNAKRTEEGWLEVKKRQEERLERKRKVLERRREEEENQINFFKKEIEEIQKELDKLDEKLKNESREVVPENIEVLKEEKKNLEQEKQNIQKEKQQLSADRVKILEDLQKSMQSRKMSTSFQLFDFYKAKERVKSLKDDQQRYLGKMINFIQTIIRQNSSVKESLMSTKTELQDLEEDAIFDIVVEYYQKSVDTEKDKDAANFRNIARKILEINEKDIYEQGALELLIQCLNPRSFVCPSISNEDRESLILAQLNKKFKINTDELAQELKHLEDESFYIKERLEPAKDDLQKVSDELEALESKIPNQERTVRNLKTQINKAKGKDEADKENLQTRGNTETDEDNAKYDAEALDKAQETLLMTEKKIRDRKDRQKDLEEEIKNLEKDMKEIRSKKFGTEKKKLEKQREKEEVTNRIIEYHYRLKIELMARVNKYMKDTSRKKIETFEKNLMQNLIAPINYYFSSEY